MLKKLRLAVFLLCPALLAAPQLAPYHYSEDFATGQAAGWTSYPPVQDVAYDPSLGPVGRGEGYALERLIRPTRSGPLEIGFIRRMSFVASPGLRLSLDLSLEPVPPDSVEVGIAARRGSLYRAQAKPGAIRLRGADFGLKSAEEVEAVYVLARVAKVSSLVEYSLQLDNVVLDAERPPRIKIEEPVLVESRGWEMRVASRIYGHGDELRLSPPVAGARLVGPDGVATRSTAGKFTPADQPGVWKAELPDGSSFAFLLVGKRPGAHPRLLDLEELRRRVGQPDFAEAWKRVQERAARSRREGPLPPWVGENLLRLYPDFLLPALPTYFALVGRNGELVINNALLSAVEDNREAREAAQKALLQAAAWPTWTPPWFRTHGMHTYYQTGLFARPLALGYDLLYPHLEPAERSAVRRALRELEILPTFREHFLDARMPFATSNWIANSMAGALTAQAAIEGEEPDQDPAVLTGLVVRLREHVQQTFLSDGSSGEPLGYEDFGLEGVGWAGGALERAYGIDFRLGTALDRAHTYPLYAAIGKNEFPDMGDGSLHSTRGFAWLAARSDDARLRRLYRSMTHDPVGELVLGPPSGGGAEKPLPPSRFFTEKGAAILRSGWDPQATVFIYRAGPNYNHNHYDAGTFFLASRGELLLSEAGVSHYYDDPHYNSHFIQAVGHNVMLVDGNTESQLMPDFPSIRALDRRPHWETALASEAADLLRTDLRRVYKTPLDSYRRTVLFVRPDYLLLCDRVIAREAHVFSWLFHAPQEEDSRVRLARDSFTVERTGVSLWARLLGSGDLRLQEREFPPPLAALQSMVQRQVPRRPYVEVSAARAPQAGLLALLYPVAAGQTAPKVEELRSPGALGIRVGAGDLAAFKLGTGALRVADAETDADSLFLRASGEVIEKLVVDSATRVYWRSRELLSSPAPVTVAAVWSATGVRGTARAASAVTFSLAAFGGTSRTVRVEVPAGESAFSVPYR